MINRKHIKTAGSAVLPFVVLLVMALSAAAFDAPRIYVKDLDIKQGSFGAGEKIDGNFLLWNTSNAAISNLSYEISLGQGHTAFGERIFQVSAPIDRNATLKQSFSYDIPKNIVSGIYQLKVQVISQSGMKLNWNTKDVKIEGDGGVYLNISESYVIRGEESFAPTVGVNFDANETVKIKFTAYNPAAEKISFKPEVKIYDFQSNGDELKSFYADEFSLDPEDKKDIEIQMPKYDKPGSYLAEVVLTNASGSISSSQEFRWVVKGAGARILNVKVDSSYLLAGKSVKATVEFVGPADMSDAGEAQLSVAVYDSKSGKLIASGEKQVGIGPDIKSETFDLIPNAGASGIQAEAKIVQNGKELSSLRADLNYIPKNINKSDGKDNKNVMYFIIGLLFFAILAASFFLRSYFKGNKKPLVIIILAGGLILGAGYLKHYGQDVEAVHTSVLNLVWNQPVKDTAYNPGNAVYYEGLAVQGTCLNDVRILEVDSYICDINKDNCIANGREKKYGVDSSNMIYNPDDGKIYVLDTETGWSRIIRVDPITKIQETTFLSNGAGVGQIHKPRDIFYSSPYFYIADGGNNRIVRFEIGDINGTWQTWTSGGAGDISFNDPYGVFYAAPYVYVADNGNNRVVRFNPSTGAWSEYTGAAIGGLIAPSDVSDGGAFIYIADTGNDRIVRFKPDNTGWQAFATDGTGTEILHDPLGVYYSSPNLYVADTVGYRVIVFDPENPGTWNIYGSGLFGSGVGQFGRIREVLYLDPYIYAADGWNFKRIVRFNPSDMNGTWDTLDFWPGTYEVSGNIPLVFPGAFQFADGVTDYDGDMVPDPAGAAYAKISASATYYDGAVDQADSFERVVVNTATPAGSCVGVSNPVDADGNVYNTVQIGTQCWMKQNMNVGEKITLCSDGYTGGPCSSAVPAQTMQQQTNDAKIEKYCYNDNDNNCNASGAIYQWAEAMQLPNACNSGDCSTSINSPHQGICPVGWHIPTDAEQHDLELFLADDPTECRANRDTGANAPPDDCDAAGTKLQLGGSSGFNGVLNGYTTSAGGPNDSKYSNLDWVGGLYSATQNGASVSETWHRHLFNAASVSPSGSKAYRHSGPKYFGDGVRCIYDNAVPPADAPSATGCVISIDDLCQLGPNPTVKFGWGYSDPEGDPQGSYRVQISEDNFATVLYDSGKQAGSQNQITTPSLGYGSSYQYKVDVWDNGDTQSASNLTCQFDTLASISHQYPTAKFEYCTDGDWNAGASECNITSASILQFQSAHFDPKDSEAYGGSSITSWAWDFDYAAGGAGEPSVDSASEYPAHTYTKIGDHVVNLRVTDSSGYACWASDNVPPGTKIISIDMNNPKENETTP